MFTDGEFAHPRCGGALCPQRACAAVFFEFRSATGRDVDGVPRWASHGAGIEIDGVIAGETAGHRGLQRQRLDDRSVTGIIKGSACGAGAIDRITEHPHRDVLACKQIQSDDRFVMARSSGFGLGAVGDDPGVRFDRDVRFETILAPVHRFVGMARVGIDGGDHPVRGNFLRDLPPPVGTVRSRHVGLPGT